MRAGDDLSSERRVSDPAGWIEAFEAKVARALMGQRIRRVQYREIDYPTGQPGYPFDNFDELDYGLELFLQSGAVVSVIWESSSFLGLEFLEETLDDLLKGYEVVWDVSTSSRWRDLLDIEISKAVVYWGWGELDDIFEVPAPIGFSVRFKDGAHVHLTYGEYHDDRPEIRGGDGVTVFFDDEVLRRYGINPEQPTKYKAKVKDLASLGKILGTPSYFLGPLRIAKTDKSD